jgi:hypothetical protein
MPFTVHIPISNIPPTAKGQLEKAICQDYPPTLAIATKRTPQSTPFSQVNINPNPTFNTRNRIRVEEDHYPTLALPITLLFPIDRSPF